MKNLRTDLQALRTFRKILFYYILQKLIVNLGKM